MSSHTEFYEQVETYEAPFERHQVFWELYRAHKQSSGRPLNVLDVGCGEHAVLAERIAPEDTYFDLDVKSTIAAPLEHYTSIDLDAEPLDSAFAGRRFDVLFCGEVIEHVFSPDRLLRQFASVMHEDTLLVLSTPNLAYWVNRILLLLGISPLFVESSAETTLGRRFRFLGPGNPTQGHLRLFTRRAMLDRLSREGFRVEGVRSVPVWHLFGDRLACRLSPHLGPNTVYALRR